MGGSTGCFILVVVLVFCTLNSEANSSPKVYLVHVDGKLSTRSAHREVLEQVLDEGRQASESHVYSYKESFTGFAARLTDQERKKLQGMEDVLAVEPSRELQLHTTRSWDFLGFPINASLPPNNVASNLIVGVFDTGIWPESESFRDDGFGPPPSKWKGACENITCNNKIIGARSYYTGDVPLAEEKSVIDVNGHGTHVASTVAGTYINNASFYGLGQGIARGGIPSARIAVYKVCWNFLNGSICSEHDIVAAVEDAIQDGVDVISASLGAPRPYYHNDPLAIASFRAMKRGVLTSASAGNSGPDRFTLSNVAPWILTVAASSIDRKFVGEMELANGFRIIERSKNAFPTQESFYPLVYGPDFQLNQTGKSMADNKAKGNNLNVITNFNGVDGASNSSARGVIVIEDICKDIALSFPLPAICLAGSDAAQVINYTEGIRNPKGKIHKSRAIFDPTAPNVMLVSSRGPSSVSPDILKPDITAPGVDILAAWTPKAGPAAADGFQSDKRSSPFNIMTGTSMACPHVSAIALYVKAFHPSWSPAAIKSALMTTATPMNPGKNQEAEFAFGSGQIKPMEAINPGLVYDATEGDYIKFLCAEGYSDRNISHITGDNTVTCSNTKSFTTKDLNYPSMSAKVAPNQKFMVKFKRTVTNVGFSYSFYTARTKANASLHVDIVPRTLSFRSLGEKLEFSVFVSGGPFRQLSQASASLVWSDGKYSVRSPILIYAL